MNIFQKIANKLFLFYRPKKSQIAIEDEKDKFDYSIIISLDKNYKTNIGVKYNTEYPDATSLILSSEKFAEMIIYLSSSVFKKSLFDELNLRLKNSENINEQIFIDNTIAFCDIIKKEITSLSKSKQPVIRPLSVFSGK